MSICIIILASFVPKDRTQKKDIQKIEIIRNYMFNYQIFLIRILC